MTRTKKRPIPMGRIEAGSVLGFGCFLACFAVALMGLVVNVMSAVLLAAAILFYVFVYTIWLKRRTAQNIVIGGAAGAFPPMIGWAAVTGNVSWHSFILFAIIFFWTMPHFWALALYKSDDYKKAGIPMMPVVFGHKRTTLEMLIYTVILVVVSLLPIFCAEVGLIYVAMAFMLGLKFIHYAYLVHRDPEMKLAPAMFAYSIIYLFALFGLMMIDKMYYIKAF